MRSACRLGRQRPLALLATILAFLGATIAPRPALAAPPQCDADAVLAAAMERHGVEVLDHAVVEFDLFGAHFRILHDGERFRYEHLHAEEDEEGPRHELIDNDGVYLVADGESRPAGDRRATGIMVNLDGGRYMTLLPHRLDDPQARADCLGETEIEGEPYREIEVTFSDDAGMGADNRFVFWVHADRHTIDYRAMDFFLPGRDGRIQQFHVATDPRTVAGVRFTDWTQYNGHPEIGADLGRLDDAWQENRLEEARAFEPRNITVKPFAPGSGPRSDAVEVTPETFEAYKDAWVEAVRAYDVDGWAALVTEDVVMITPRGQVFEGRQAFHDLWTRAFENASGPNPLEVSIQDVKVSGDLAVVLAPYGPEGRDPVGHYTWALEQGPDGDWAVSLWMFSRLNPPE